MSKQVYPPLAVRFGEVIQAAASTNDNTIQNRASKADDTPSVLLHGRVSEVQTRAVPGLPGPGVWERYPRNVPYPVLELDRYSSAEVVPHYADDTKTKMAVAFARTDASYLGSTYKEHTQKGPICITQI
uniref:Uncharacterized protein n=1 Tax=Cacopsylla melanoneura TaxID=428564 RepID=A0A8D8VX73_9HEMI